MPVQNLPVEVNSFVKGLITEASPLTFPENASLDEKNFVLNRDGSRRRRLGMELKTPLTTLTDTTTVSGLSTKVFEWENAGGLASSRITVVQIDDVIAFFNSSSSVSSQPEYLSQINVRDYITLTTTTVTACDMSSVEGKLVVVLDERDILIAEYDSEVNTFSFKTDYLKVRDLFGLEDPYNRVFTVVDGEFLPSRDFGDLLEDVNARVRPLNLNDWHIYNLRNQSWGRLRDGLYFKEDSSDTNLREDCIESFRLAHRLRVQDEGGEPYDVFPSTGDIVASGIIDYAELKGAPERFVPLELGKDSKASSTAPKGFFIIDALQRGLSRQQEHDKMIEEGRGKFLYKPFFPIIEDTTPNGAKCVEEFAGRVWYSGFDSTVIGGDARSPRMGSYVLYSQLVSDLSNITSCYQQNDPTYEEEADLLATDGGFIRLDEAYGINRMTTLDSSLLVFAENGVWSISGGTDTGFSAEAYIVKKITDKGCISPNSVVDLGGAVMYWAENSIYLVQVTEIGGITAQNISEKTIQTLYEDIPQTQKINCSGMFDKYDNKVRWVYGDKTLGTESKELVFDLSLSAFYPSEIKAIDGNSPCLLHPLLVNPFKVGTQEDNIVMGDSEDSVVVSDAEDNVVISRNIDVSGTKETMYLTVWEENPLRVGFSSYSNITFTDWPSYNGGVDAEAYLVTGYGPSGDFQRRKQVPYLTLYFLRTEDGFEEVSGDVVPTNQSSCKFQSQWNWANSVNSNKWGREMQGYRYKRFYIPEDINDPYDTGDKVITTKNKLRGHGKTLSLKFRTEPNKDCRLLGWSMVIGVSTSV